MQLTDSSPTWWQRPLRMVCCENRGGVQGQKQVHVFVPTAEKTWMSSSPVSAVTSEDTPEEPRDL